MSTATETAATVKACHTCLYMGTHENCDGCLRSPEDYAAIRADRRANPPFRYTNHTPGNWLARVMRHEIEGKRNIVIGGQGEAEVNTSWTPQRTSDHLHYVAEQCGYLAGKLHRSGQTMRLSIHTHDGPFELEWAAEGDGWRLDYIWALTLDPDTGRPVDRSESWGRNTCELFPPEAAEAE